MLHFFGMVRIKADKIKDVEDAIRKFMPVAQAEEGTLAYVVYHHAEDPTLILFDEIYRDQDAKAEHNKSEGLKQMMGVLRPAFDGEATKGYWEEIASIKPAGRSS